MKQIYYILFIGLFLLKTSGTYAQDLSGITIYVNPGHGGFDSDDRNIPVGPYGPGDVNGFWESQSNLDKGVQLVELLKGAKANVYISRTTNTTADDLTLTQIVREANECNADYMLELQTMFFSFMLVWIRMIIIHILHLLLIQIVAARLVLLLLRIFMQTK